MIIEILAFLGLGVIWIEVLALVYTFACLAKMGFEGACCFEGEIRPFTRLIDMLLFIFSSIAIISIVAFSLTAVVDLTRKYYESRDVRVDLKLDVKQVETEEK